MDILISKKSFYSAFSRIELLAVLFAVVLLAVLVALFAGQSRNKGKMARCVSNLKQLGLGMALYEGSNDGKLPYAYIKYDEHRFDTWDRLIYPFVQEGSDTKGHSLSESMLTPENLLRCPSDTIRVPAKMKGFHRRTYSMAWHNSNKANLPPGADNATGVGLTFTFAKKSGAGESEGDITATDENIPAVQLSMIPVPGSTLLLAEKARKANILFHVMGAEIRKAAECLDTQAMPMNKYQQGKFNYLMVDGHVETLFPEQTVGKTGMAKKISGGPSKNIWTIRPD